jgi:hypothetical protein
MKKLLFFTVLTLISITVKAQQPVSGSKPIKAPSDAITGYTYDYDKVFDLLHKAVTGSVISRGNTEQQLMNTPDFPKVDAHLNNEPFLKASLKQWIETHPDLIIEAYKSNADIVKPFAR